jgi:hypothetical protein
MIDKILEKIFWFLWTNKTGFLLGCIINVGATYYLGSKVVLDAWGGDLPWRYMPILVMSLIHGFYMAPIGLWTKFLKQIFNEKYEGEIGAILLFLYWVLYYVMLRHAGL